MKIYQLKAWFRFTRAKVLGKKHSYVSNAITITSYEYNGIQYVTDIEGFKCN